MGWEGKEEWESGTCNFYFTGNFQNVKFFPPKENACFSTLSHNIDNIYVEMWFKLGCTKCGKSTEEHVNVEGCRKVLETIFF